MCLHFFREMFSGRPELPRHYQGFSVSTEYDELLEDYLAKLEIPNYLPHLSKPDLLRFNNRKSNDDFFVRDPNNPEWIQRNYRALARRTLKGFENHNLSSRFSGKKEISVVSVGCGLGFEIIPLLVYFHTLGITVNYLGCDIQPGFISIAQPIFKYFEGNVRFVAQDIDAFIGDETFDLVVCQHPNFEKFATVFSKIFVETIPRIAEGAHLYASFYYPREREIFKTHVLDQSPCYEGSFSGHPQDTYSIINRHTKEGYAPERCTYATTAPIKSSAPSNSRVVAGF